MTTARIDIDPAIMMGKPASIFRMARSKGITVTTVDTLIAAIALENRARVFTLDHDFSRIARIAPLRLYTPPHP